MELMDSTRDLAVATGHVPQAGLPQGSCEVCSEKDILVEGDVTNPNVSWKNRIKLRPEE